MNHDETRKYIHDLANSFSIIDASISRALTLLNKNHPELTDEIQKIKKADEYVKKSVQTLRELRQHIHNQIRPENSD
jgi:hypothetical protein